MYQKPKKRLGQNFLVDKNIQRKIISACELTAADVVLEIGAGQGALTGLIAEKVDRVCAVELDSSLCHDLRERFKAYANLEIANCDILKFNPRKHFNGLKNKIKVIGNIPYYITTSIIEHLLTYRDKIDSIFLTVQKEFAARMSARAGSKDYSSFSLFLRYYTEPKALFLIKKTCFYPAPKVDSCFLRLEVREAAIVELKSERLFFRIIRAAFEQRRKTLRNSLDGVVSQDVLERFFIQRGIDSNIRPEELTLKDFANLANTEGKSQIAI